MAVIIESLIYIYHFIPYLFLFHLIFFAIFEVLPTFLGEIWAIFYTGHMDIENQNIMTARVVFQWFFSWQIIRAVRTSVCDSVETLIHWWRHWRVKGAGSFGAIFVHFPMLILTGSLTWLYVSSGWGFWMSCTCWSLCACIDNVRESTSYIREFGKRIALMFLSINDVQIRFWAVNGSPFQNKIGNCVAKVDI